ncbi:SIS domain-containing protein [Lacticaseibacillus daqingensis]|uniref:SIS domain-containing protein n=1 Tax=Lacticaseibacillus daqingensis TaxID=2486014 RepID=UPI000F7B60AC|nr:SIS domain-containing protein [Lacticaseibacillus daqingensis]
METMMEVIRDIPKLTRKRVKTADQIEAEFANVKAKHITVIASGSSYNAAFGTKVFAEEKLGIEIELHYPNYFFNHIIKNGIDEKTLYLFISQTGKTKTVLDTIKDIDSRGGITVALTEKADAPIAQAAKYAFEIGSVNEPYMFRTSGFTLSLVALNLLVIQLAKNNGDISVDEQKNYWDELLEVADNMPTTIGLAEKWFEDHEDIMAEAGSFFFAGGGALWPTAQEAGIKFMEMVPVLTNTYEIEEIIHGPQNSFNAKSVFFLMAEQEVDLEKAEKIRNFITHEITPNAFLLSRNSTEDTVKLDTNSVDFYPMLYITFLQVLSYLTATKNGRDLSRTMYPQITHYINKTVK